MSVWRTQTTVLRTAATPLVATSVCVTMDISWTLMASPAMILMNVKKELHSVTLMPHVPTQWDPTTVPVSMATVEMDSTVPVLICVCSVSQTATLMPRVPPEMEALTVIVTLATRAMEPSAKMLMSVVHKRPTCVTAMPLAQTLMVAMTAAVSLDSLETASTAPISTSVLLEWITAAPMPIVMTPLGAMTVLARWDILVMALLVKMLMSVRVTPVILRLIAIIQLGLSRVHVVLGSLETE
jgi:hypothetical protein